MGEVGHQFGSILVRSILLVSTWSLPIVRGASSHVLVICVPVWLQECLNPEAITSASGTDGIQPTGEKERNPRTASRWPIEYVPARLESWQSCPRVAFAPRGSFFTEMFYLLLFVSLQAGQLVHVTGVYRLR